MEWSVHHPQLHGIRKRNGTGALSFQGDICLKKRQDLLHLHYI